MNGYIQFSRATYSHLLRGERYVEEIMIGDYDNEPGVLDRGEFALRWYDLQGKLCLHLEMFEDAFAWLTDPIIGALWALHKKEPSVNDVLQILDRLDFTDMTPTKEEEPCTNGNKTE